MKIHKKISPKTQKSINIGKNDPRAKKVAPRIGKKRKRGKGERTFDPSRAPKISQSRKKRTVENRRFFRPPPGTDLSSFWIPPGTQKTAKMGSNSAPGLPKRIFGENAYFVGPANEIHTFCILKIIQNKPKTAKKT